MSDKDSHQSSLDLSAEIFEESGPDEDYEVLNFDAGAPYQDEPLAIDDVVEGDVGGNEDEEDPDGISFATLEGRYERRVSVSDW